MHVAEVGGARAVYLLADRRLKPLAGNLPAWPANADPKAGWSWGRLRRGGAVHTVRFFRASLPGGFNLLVGRYLGDRGKYDARDRPSAAGAPTMCGASFRRCKRSDERHTGAPPKCAADRPFLCRALRSALARAEGRRSVEPRGFTAFPLNGGNRRCATDGRRNYLGLDPEGTS